MAREKDGEGCRDATYLNFFCPQRCPMVSHRPRVARSPKIDPFGLRVKALCESTQSFMLLTTYTRLNLLDEYFL